MRLTQRLAPDPAEVICVAVITRSGTDWRTYDMTGRRRHAAPPATDLPFPVGSVSKLVTALAIHRLGERGELRMDERVHGVSGSPGQRPPNLRDLLAHSSGLPPWQGVAGQFHAYAGPGVQWCYSTANYIAAARYAALRLGTPFDAAVTEIIADPCGTEFLGRPQRRPGVPGLEFPGAGLPSARLAVRCPTGHTWPAHGMLASWHDLLALLRESLRGGQFYWAAESLRQPYTSGVTFNPFQGLGARIFRCGEADWATHGGNWPGHRMAVAIGRESAVAAYSSYRDRTPVMRNIVRSVIVGDAMSGQVDDGRKEDREELRETLSPAGAAALSLGARVAIGSQVRLTCGPEKGTLTGKRPYPLTAVPDSPGTWQYRVRNEDLRLHVSRVLGALRVIVERPACVLEPRR
jgi:CubicO group peptidase (beta-lactamase class C family)